jgi:hypothetical protein
VPCRGLELSKCAVKPRLFRPRTPRDGSHLGHSFSSGAIKPVGSLWTRSDSSSVTRLEGFRNAALNSAGRGNYPSRLLRLVSVAVSVVFSICSAMARSVARTLREARLAEAAWILAICTMFCIGAECRVTTQKVDRTGFKSPAYVIPPPGQRRCKPILLNCLLQHRR